MYRTAANNITGSTVQMITKDSTYLKLLALLELLTGGADSYFPSIEIVLLRHLICRESSFACATTEKSCNVLAEFCLLGSKPRQNAER